MKKTKLIVLLFLMGWYSNLSYAQKINKNLIVDEEVLKTIEIRAEHQYKVLMQKGHFGLINLQQKGIDVKVIIYDPNEKEIEVFDSPNGAFGSELIVIDANISGLYTLKVIPLQENKKKGSYTIKLVSKTNTINLHLDKSFKLIGDNNYLPGFFVSIINDEEILYTNGQGFANIEAQIPYTVNTIQQIESISKTFLGLSIMLLVEEEKLDLDRDINTYLPFKVTNPYFLNIPITIRNLATHTASINDYNNLHESLRWIENKDVFYQNKKKYVHKERRKYYKSLLKNKKLSMEDFLKSYFDTKGKNYSNKNFLKLKPGGAWFYSNIGATLAAYIVQRVSRQPYHEFVEKNIITALNLKHTSWGYNPDLYAKQAVKYGGGKNEYPRIVGPTYPDGSIYSSTADLSQYLMHWMKGYRGKSLFLKSESYQDIMTVQFEETKGQFKSLKNGLFWWIFPENRMGSNGGDMGTNANMFFCPNLNVGYTSLENMQYSESDGAVNQSIQIKKIITRYLKHFSSSK